MRTDTEMMNLILQIAESLQVEAVALSGSRVDIHSLRDEFQDYDVVYIVENLNDLLSDLSWLDQFGMRLIEQHNVLGHRRLYLMLFEDGNRIDLTLCPKEHIQEWTCPPTEEEFATSCNEFWWVSTYVVKAIRRNQLIYATNHLYGICQQELLKVLAWQVASDREIVDIGKNYKYLFNYLPAEKEKELSNLLDFSSLDKITQSLLATLNVFHREAQSLAKKMGFDYDRDEAENMIAYTEEKLSNH